MPDFLDVILSLLLNNWVRFSPPPHDSKSALMLKINDFKVYSYSSSRNKYFRKRKKFNRNDSQ